ncbi:acyltransferase [Aquincola sp. J276]|uniref:acyltransferase family protein n=1 Tax=Aquincola sp. J276 TaxID=2898432 RepID=UPI0021508499|nr:acyltransferase [Aquincola sp. J276]MCR5868306.1 acyltransferase [Aquincola sp. J276]
MSSRLPPAALVHAPASPAIDLAKVLAAHLILFHHLVQYGPVPDDLGPLLDGPLGWLAEHGRLAVQVFLVIAGYLGAASMLSRVGGPAPAARGGLAQQAGRLVRQRAWRLLPTYWLAAAAMLAVLAWLSAGPLQRPLPTPGIAATLANLLLLQDLLGHDGLSAGFWYVAIDLQLYGGLVLLALGCAALPLAPATRLRAFTLAAAGLAAASLLHWNRDAGLDAWAVYFAGAYGLGMLACLLRGGLGWQPAPAACAVAALAGLALLLDWRSRIAVAGATAVALCLLARLDDALRHGPVRLPAGMLAALPRLSGASYAFFLLHYPLLVLVCETTVAVTDHPGAHVAAVLACWPLSLLAALAVQRWMQPAAAPRARLAGGT